MICQNINITSLQRYEILLRAREKRNTFFMVSCWRVPFLPLTVSCFHPNARKFGILPLPDGLFGTFCLFARIKTSRRNCAFRRIFRIFAENNLRPADGEQVLPVLACAISAENTSSMTQEEKTRTEERIVDVLKTVYDPEIPVDIWNLGMIYKIEVKDDHTVDLDMTFTAPSCPAADFILEDVRTKVESLEEVKSANVNLVFEPAWDQSMMSEEARVELGFD